MNSCDVEPWERPLYAVSVALRLFRVRGSHHRARLVATVGRGPLPAPLASPPQPSRAGMTVTSSRLFFSLYPSRRARDNERVRRRRWRSSVVLRCVVETGMLYSAPSTRV